VSRIVDRYVIREIAKTCFGVTFVLLLILVGNQFARVLGRAAQERLTRDAVFELLWLSSIEYLTVLLPLALFFAVVLSLGRLYRDSEVTAMSACGIGPLRLCRPVLLFAGLLAALVAWLSFEVGPWVAYRTHLVKVEAKRQLRSAALVPGRFRIAPGGAIVFYARSADDDGTLRDVFIQRREGERVEAVIAERAEQALSSDGSRRDLLLKNGRRYVGVPGSLDFYIVDFEEHGIPIILPSIEDYPEERETRGTAELLASDIPVDQAEFQWRLAAPISLVLLALVAVPLSRTNSRTSRFDRMGFAILAYLIYTNLLGVGRNMVETGKLAPWLGVNWVHLCVLLLSLLAIAWQSGWRVRWRRRRVATA
jgi:lipopolysaccharide export system permease protein